MDQTIDIDDFDLSTDDFDNTVDSLGDDYLLALSLQALEEEFNSKENKNRKSIVDSDYALALSLSEIDGQTDSCRPSGSSRNTCQKHPKDVVHPQLELVDPSPNIWHLMKEYDQLFFGGVLSSHCIELGWSTKMTRTAGLCAWCPQTNYCSIKLSLPLLQLRSRRDLVETLIHEMIHALLFVTREDDNHESHGKKFHEHMDRINRESGANITVYHDFHDEVDYYLKHIWRCDGQCRNRPPYYGYVKRSMNRKPGPSDYWFKFHQQSCGGNFIKIGEPSKTNDKPAKAVSTPQLLKVKEDIRDFFSPSTSGPSAQVIPVSGLGTKLGNIKTETPKPNLKQKDIRNDFKPTKSESTNTIAKVVPFSGFGHKLGSDQSNHVPNTRRPVNPSRTKTNSNETAPNPHSVVNHKKIDTKGVRVSENHINFKEENDEKQKSFGTKIEPNLKPFSGRGFVLGNKKEANLSKTGRPSIALKPNVNSSPPKKLKENVEVIQID